MEDERANITYNMQDVNGMWRIVPLNKLKEFNKQQDYYRKHPETWQEQLKAANSKLKELREKMKFAFENEGTNPEVQN